MLSQDKCLPIAYKCLGFTVLFVLEKYCGFKTVFIWHREIINTSRSCLQPLRRRPRGIAPTSVCTHRLGRGSRPGSWVPLGGQWGESDTLKVRDPTVLSQVGSLSCRDLSPPPLWPQTACCRGDKATSLGRPCSCGGLPERYGGSRAPQAAGGRVRPSKPETRERNISGHLPILEMKSTAFFGWRLSVP